MKLYKLTQKENRNYDTFDSAIVAATDEKSAKRINPRSSHIFWCDKNNSWATKNQYKELVFIENDTCWANKMKNIKVQYLGEASPEIEQGIVLVSFNAG